MAPWCIYASCIERVARCGSGRGVVGTMNAARSRPDWLATVQSGRKQVQSRVCTPGFRMNRCYIKRTFFMLRLYEAIRSTVLDRLRHTIVHWINQPIICVIRVQTCNITSNCRCPQVSIISDLSCTETVDAKHIFTRSIHLKTSSNRKSFDL